MCMNVTMDIMHHMFCRIANCDKVRVRFTIAVAVEFAGLGFTFRNATPTNCQVELPKSPHFSCPMTNKIR